MTISGYRKAEQVFCLELDTLLAQAKLGSIARQPRMPAIGEPQTAPSLPLPGKQ